MIEIHLVLRYNLIKEVIHMDQWQYDLDDAWIAMSAVAMTLKKYMDQYIIKQFGCDGPDMEQLKQEIDTVYARIQKIRGRQ